MKGWLSVINNEQEASLYQSIRSLFERMHEALKSLLSQTNQLQMSAIEAGSSSTDDEK